jgi:hypothetical protein
LSIHAGAAQVLTSSETLRRAAEILERLSAGGKPDPRALADAPLAEAWSIIPGEDVYRIGAVPQTPARTRPRIVPLLAIDLEEKWALVLAGDRIAWWVLGEPMAGTAAPQDGTVVIRLAAAWTRRWLQ